MAGKTTGNQAVPLSFPVKDPDEVLDFAIDWSDALDGDTISSSTWSVDADNDDAVLDISVSGHPASFTDTTATLWCESGTAGVRYKLYNTVVTAGGRTLQESVYIKVAAK